MSDKISVKFNLRNQPNVLHKIIPRIVSCYEDDVCVCYAGGERSIRLGLIDPGLIISLSSLGISAISLILTIKHRIKEQETWTQAKLIAAVNEEMLKRGLMDAEIVAVHNYIGLTTGSAEPCVVEVKIGLRKQIFRVYIFHDKQIFTIQL